MNISRIGTALSAIGLLAASVIQTANAGDVLNFKNAQIRAGESHHLLTDASSTNYFVIQFKEKITTKNQNWLQALGVKVYRYIPDDAYLVKLGKYQLKRLQKSEEIQQVVPFVSQLKISQNFEPASIFNKNQKEKVIVQVIDKNELNAVKEDVAKIGEVQSASGKVISVIIKRYQRYELAKVEGVEWIESMPQMETFMVPFDSSEVTPEPSKGNYKDLEGYEDGTTIMQMADAWARGFNGAGEIVTMADTGLDTGELNTLFADFGNVAHGYSFGLFTKTWRDPMGHGTHVAGSVMSSGAGNGGYFTGAAPNAQLIAEAMWSDMMENLTVPTNLSDLFTPAYNDGSRVHTNSWGSPRNLGAYDGMAAQVDEFMWEHPDFLILFAAGNSGIDKNKDGRIDEGSVSSPGTAKNALTVGASENYILNGGIQRKLGELLDGKPWGVEPLASDTLSDDPNGIAAFSSRGPTRDGRLKPEVVAPGTNIVSNCSHVKDSSPLWGHYNNDYCYSGGTSMSTPLTAGAAAVMRQYLKTLGIANPSAAAVKAALMHTADDMYPGQYGVGRGQELDSAGPNNHQGFGRVNMNFGTSGLYVVIDNAEVGNGETYEIPVNNFRKATLVYTDAPGSASANRALVNNLDLIVEYSGQTVSSTSTVNNTEAVILPTEVASAKIIVKGTNIPTTKNGKLPFAIVLSR